MMCIAKKSLFKVGLISAIIVTGWFHLRTEEIFRHVEVIVNAKTEGVQIDEIAPAFTLPTLSGKEKTYKAGGAAVTVIHFFSTWCYPCQEEMPLIVKLEEEMTAKENQFIAVNLTSSETDRSQLQPFLNHYGASFDPLLDKAGLIQKKYQIFGIPTTLILDQKGKIISRINGPMNEEQVKMLLER